MNSEIIELREQSANPLNPIEFGYSDRPNGNYTVDIKGSNVCLQDGDQCIVKSCFLDTRTETAGQITIDDKNGAVRIQHYVYLNDFRANKDNSTVSYSGADTERPDGKFYILNQRFDTTGTTLLQITEAFAKLNSRGYGHHFGNFYQTYEYTDPRGQKQQTTFYYPDVDSMAPDNPTKSIVANVGKVIFRSTGNLSEDFKVVAGDTNYKSYFVDAPQFETTPASEGDSFIPVVYTTEFKIPNGNYTPDLLANTITDNIVKLNQDTNAGINTALPKVNLKGGGTAIFPSNNFFITSTKQICNVQKYGVYEGTPAAPPAAIHFVLWNFNV